MLPLMASFCEEQPLRRWQFSGVNREQAADEILTAHGGITILVAGAGFRYGDLKNGCLCPLVLIRHCAGLDHQH